MKFSRFFRNRTDYFSCSVSSSGRGEAGGPGRLSSTAPLRAGLALALGAFSAAAPAATAFSSDINIMGSALINTPSAPTAASQTGSLTEIAGGVTTGATLAGTVIGGANPLIGTLTDIGDGFGIAFNSSGTSASGGTAAVDNLFGDFQLSINNTSSTDTYIVTLKVSYVNQVNASGADAFGLSQITLNDEFGGNYFYTGLQSDTVNGNYQYDMPNSYVNTASGSGGSLADSGSYLLPFTVAPSSALNLGDSSPELRVTGGTFALGGFSAAGSVLFTVNSVEDQKPLAAPLPAPFALFGAGLLSLCLAGTRPGLFRLNPDRG